MDSTDLAPPPSLDWSAVERWLRTAGRTLSRPDPVKRLRLSGGQVADSVERWDIPVRADDGSEQIATVVVKRTGATERVALSALRAVSQARRSVPVLIDCGTDGTGAWILTPFYPGESPEKNHDAPPSVFSDLARIHAYFSDHATLGELTDIGAITDQTWIDLCRTWTFAGIAAAREDHDHPVLHRAERLVDRWATDTRMSAALQSLPPVLLHGDVHSGNILIGGDTAVLIDWGNARIGPAMLDVVNCAPPRSRNFRTYLAAWEQTTGTSLTPRDISTGVAWATVHVNVQYLGWAVQHLSPERVATMLDTAERAVADLAAPR